MLSEREELKIEIFHQGIHLADEARDVINQGKRKPLTTGDFASTNGIVLDLGEHIFVNAPFRDLNKNFVEEETPHTLDFSDGKFCIVSTGRVVEARFVPPPSYISRSNPRGKVYKEMIATHTDRARISPIQGCAIACHFCDIPYGQKYNRHSIPNLIDSITVAIDDPALPTHHLLISGGTPKPEDYEYENQVYEAVTAAFPGLDVDVMMAPAFCDSGRELLDPKRLKRAGIHELSINLELWNPQIAQRITPGKFRIGRERYLAFMEKAVQEFGIGGVRSILMVGIEPIEDTLNGVQALAERGISPELSPLRPDPITPLKGWPAPSVELQKEVYQRSREIIDKYPGVYMGLRCIPCMHNVLNFPDMSGYYYPHYDRKNRTTTYQYL